MKNVKKKIVIWAAVSKPDKQKPSDPDVKDKYSLKDQELLGIAFAEANDYEIVRIFRWPGHSRDESDVIQALEDFAKVGRLEYQELREMWRKHEFDVLWCHNHSRLGRSFTLQSWVIENVIRSGARIYRHVGGWINEDDYGGQIALGGWANTQERGRRLVQNDAGLSRRAEKGLNLNKVPFPHRLVRDPIDGKPLRMEINPANRVFLDHLYELLMENVPLTVLGRELFLRFGHANPATGRAWGARTLYEMLHRPSFWGHSARKFSTPEGRLSLFHDGWGFDVNAPVPEGVIIHRNTHEPAYRGKQAEDIQSAIRFHKNLAGIPVTYQVHHLSGIVFCPECYHQMHYNKTTARHAKYYYLFCPTHYDFTRHHRVDDCQNTRHIRETEVFAFIEKILLRAYAGEDLAAIFGETETTSSEDRIQHLTSDIERQQRLVDRLILQSAEFDDSVAERSKLLITEADQKLQSLVAEKASLTEQHAIRETERKLQMRAMQRLKEIPLEDLWTSDAGTVNRLLKDFFARRAIFILDGVILGTNLRPVRSRKRGKPYVRP